MVEVRIREDIFKTYPSFRRGIVIARNLQNQGPSQRLEELLSDAMQKARTQPTDLKDDARVTIWNEAHRQFGSNPNKFPPAHLSLLKRVQKPESRIPFISKIVSIMNYNSIVDIIPVGGDDLDCAGGLLELRFASGKEIFTPLGSPEVKEHPDPGEVIYVAGDSDDVMCRRWNWRNGHKTRITEETRSIVMNIDGIGEGNEPATLSTRDRVGAMLAEYCGAAVTLSLLSPSNTAFRFES